MKFGLFLFAIVVVCCMSVNGQQPKCNDVGGYCQNHWDCCSNSCLSYSYKCVRSYQNGNTWENDIPSEELTLDELLEQLHLNGRAKMAPVKKENIAQPKCLEIGQRCTQGIDCCTQRCPSFWGKCTT